MALNLDDLIGSMQQVHAGDRGQGLEEIRENLRATLGPQAMGPEYPFVNAAAGKNAPYPAFNAGPSANGRRRPHNHHNNSWSRSANASVPFGGASFEGDAAMYMHSPTQQNGQSNMLRYEDGICHASTSTNNSANSATKQQDFSRHSGSGFGEDNGGLRSGPGTGGDAYARSFGSSGSWNTSSSGAGSSGFGFAPAPTNTPQQTPSDRSGGGPFGSGSVTDYHNYTHQHPAGGGGGAEDGAAASGTATGTGMDEEDGSGMLTPGDPHQQMHRATSSSPKRLVNGFFTPMDSTTASGSGAAA